MFNIVPVATDNLNRIDVAATDELFAITVEFKNSSADFWVSGLTRTSGLVVLARLSVPVHTVDGETGAMQQAEAIYEKWLAPIAQKSQADGGIPQVPEGPSATFKKLLCEAHLDIHKFLGGIGSPSIDPKLDVARQYQLIKSVGFKSAIPMIAKREGLKTTTVIRRLDTAKAQGILPKTEQPPHLRD